jgi:hypothetical protein
MPTNPAVKKKDFHIQSHLPVSLYIQIESTWPDQRFNSFENCQLMHSQNDM